MHSEHVLTIIEALQEAASYRIQGRPATINADLEVLEYMVHIGNNVQKESIKLSEEAAYALRDYKKKPELAKIAGPILIDRLKRTLEFKLG